MSTKTIDTVPTGETCAACGEELTLERCGATELDLTCGCSITSALA